MEFVLSIGFSVPRLFAMYASVTMVWLSLVSARRIQLLCSEDDPVFIRGAHSPAE